MRTASALRRFLFVFIVVVVVIVVVLLLFQSGLRVSGGIVYVYRQQQHQPKKKILALSCWTTSLCFVPNQQNKNVKRTTHTNIYQEIDYSLALFSFICSATVYIIIMQISLFSLRVSLSLSTKTNNTYAEETLKCFQLLTNHFFFHNKKSNWRKKKKNLGTVFQIQLFFSHFWWFLSLWFFSSYLLNDTVYSNLKSLFGWICFSLLCVHQNEPIVSTSQPLQLNLQ